MMWHAGRCWDVGSSANVGQTRGFVNVPDGALSPDAVHAQWEVWNDDEGTWVVAPGVRCLGQWAGEPRLKIWDVENDRWVPTYVAFEEPADY